MIGLFNIQTGERVNLDNPHLIAAFINSSDMHVNAGQGQDFGWRLGAEDIVRINKLKADPTKVREIAEFLGKPASDIRQMDYIKYVSHLDDLDQQVKSKNESETPAFQAQYEAELKAAEEAARGGSIREDVAAEAVEDAKELPVTRVTPKKK